MCRCDHFTPLYTNPFHLHPFPPHPTHLVRQCGIENCIRVVLVGEDIPGRMYAVYAVSIPQEVASRRVSE